MRMEGESEKKLRQQREDREDRERSRNVTQHKKKKWGRGIERFTFRTQFNYHKIRDKTLAISSYQIQSMAETY